MQEQRKLWYARLGLPLRVGMICATIGIVLAIVGIVRGNVPFNPVSIILALLISGGSWGVVSWAVTTAVVDVEGETASDTGPATDGSEDHG